MKAFGPALHKTVFDIWLGDWEYPCNAFGCTIMAGVCVFDGWLRVLYDHGLAFGLFLSEVVVLFVV